MERFLIALDCRQDFEKILDYMARVLQGASHCEFRLLHILPTTSPDRLWREEIRRIEDVHAARPDLAGYFWAEDDEKTMTSCFDKAKDRLVQAGFSPDSISSSFAVESADRADIILAKAAELGCSTIVLGRSHPGLVKEFLRGSVARAVMKSARSFAVWIIEM
ncbi:MAG: universal stress protein [Syntrophobacteraceae bacterium]|nr:universal stress protein [Syntrophobacteraceae bacterium]